MNRFPSAPTLFALGSIVWLIVLGCRVADVVAQGGAISTRAATRTAPRPTFTAAPPTQPPTDVPPPASPTSVRPPASPTRASAPRPAPTRTHTPAPSPTPAPLPTANPYFYGISKIACTSGGNTRIIGTVYERGVKANGIRVRVSYIPGGEAVIPDFITGVDPNDPKRRDDSLQGQYRLALQEGGLRPGNWYVFILNNLDVPMSPNANVQTDDKPGCNIATVDFAHD